MPDLPARPVQPIELAPDRMKEFAISAAHEFYIAEARSIENNLVTAGIRLRAESNAALSRNRKAYESRLAEIDAEFPARPSITEETTTA